MRRAATENDSFARDILDDLFDSFADWLRERAAQVKAEAGYRLFWSDDEVPRNFSEKMEAAGYTDYGYQWDDVAYDLYSWDGALKVAKAMRKAGIRYRNRFIREDSWAEEDETAVCAITGAPIQASLTDYAIERELDHWMSQLDSGSWEPSDSDWYWLNECYENCPDDEKDRMSEILTRLQEAHQTNELATKASS